MIYNNLALFVVLAQELNFTKVAQRTAIPASRVSRRIAELEAHLGVKLFERTTRMVRLTEEGRRLLDRCQTPFEQLQDVAGVFSEGARPILRLTAPPLAARTTIGPRLLAFAARHPELQVDLTTTTAELDFVRDNIDLAFRLGPLSDSTLVARKLWHVPYAFCAGRGFAEQHGLLGPISRERLLAVPAILARQSWTLQNGEVLKPTNITHLFDDLNLVHQAMVLGMGVAMLPEDMLEKEAVVLDVAQTQPLERAMYAVYPSRRLLPARVRALIEHMSEGGQGSPQP
ncbi:LysR family transcriptional regulator [Pseudovibrio sp. SPO723]|uniref:LysR family transcriptional regulator n=1 Tax=Nesiotobacter zosterae TaxID=392721 RepID=UPI0029C3A8BE|nr:LysR family transcriptional regulator [Pseudovibrio sp. SPO723]MDX5593356.1 LysR family transcriptional regulator [Pseudovibrio sp. SPO723]